MQHEPHYLLGVGTRSEDSYISRDGFLFSFRENFWNLIMFKFHFLLSDLWFHFKLSLINLLKGRQTPLSNSKNIRSQETKYQSWNLIIRFLSEIQVLLFDPVFSNWIKFFKKSLNHNFFLKFEGALWAYILLFEIRKLKFFKT